jgi:hypothetical protein
MKKFTFLLLFFLIGFSAFSQKANVLFEQDFSDTNFPPTGWTIDGMPTQWSRSATANAGGTAPEAKLAYTSANPATTRLISPVVNTTGVSSVLFSFNHFLDHYGAGYSVGVATRSNGGSWNNVWTVNPTGNIGPEIKNITISNSDVGSSTFQVCLFLTGNFYQFDYWFMDNLKLFIPDNNDAQLESINTTQYNAAGNIDISCSMVNVGLNMITSVDFNYQIDDGPIVTETINGLNVNTMGSFYHVFTTPWAASPGNYSLKVWVSNMNGLGDDDDTSNDLLTQNMSIASQSVQNMPLFEEFTSSTCAPCASFNASTFTPFMTAHPDDITVIKYQMSWPTPGDPYYTAEGGTRRAYYGVSFVPDLFTGGINTATTSDGVNDAYDYQTAKPAFFDINSYFELNGNVITVNVDIMPYLSAQNFTVQMAVIEKITTGNVGNNGETSFKNVMMKMLPDANGTNVEFTSGVNSYITESFDLSTTNVEEIEDIAVVVFIQNNITKEVFQSSYSTPPPYAYFNPEDGDSNVDALADITITFNQPLQNVDDSEITNENIVNFVNFSDTGNPIPFTAIINPEKTIITIVPDALLPETTDLTLSISENTIENVWNVALPYSSASFTTGTYPIANVVFNPINSAINVPVTSNITLTFNDPMRKVDDSELVNGDLASLITFTDASLNPIAFTGSINAQKDIITINPDDNLPFNTQFTVTLTGDQIENFYNLSLGENSSTFTTVANVGLNDMSDLVKVYPNPSKEFIFVSGAQNAILKLTDVLGKQILQQNITNHLEKIDLNNLSPGLYIISIDANGNHFESKLTIVK